MKKFVIILISLILFTVIIGGCLNEKSDSAITPSSISQATPSAIQTSLATPTIDETLWVPVLDNTYVLTYQKLAITHASREKDILVSPDTAYRLQMSSEYPLIITLFDSEEPYQYTPEGYMKSGGSQSGYLPVVSRVSSYNGIIKTKSYHKILRFEWILNQYDDALIGKSQNVHVKMERYAGNASIIPETTPEII
jgi:hypothetical protein